MLFDLDGTLVDVAVDIAAVRTQLAELFAPLGYRGTFSPILARIDQAARAIGRDPQDVAAWIGRGRALITEAECEARLTEKPDARRVLQRLAEVGVGLAVVTNNDSRVAHKALSLLEQPAVVIGRDQVVRPKPDPDGVCRAARVLVPDGGVLWMVGDSPADMAAARAAAERLADVDVRAVGVLGGRGGSAELLAAGGDAVIGGLAEFLSLQATSIAHAGHSG